MKSLFIAIFGSMIKELFDVGEQHTDPTEQDLQLTKHEDNILRYACGYVVVKLQLEFIKQPGNKAAVFVDCLDRMENKGSTSSP